MKINNIFKLIIAIVVSELAGIIGLFFTIPAISDWYAGLVKPALNPPEWIFEPVWIVLYFLIGVSLFLVWKNDWKTVNLILENKRKAWNVLSERLWTGNLQKANVIAIFVVQYILNILWSFIFFGLHLPGLAFFEILALWFAIVFTIFNFYRISKLAAYLLLPYILWVSFTAYLNFSIWQLNIFENLGEAAHIQNDSFYSDKQKENLIRIFLPKPYKEISNPLLISGEARGNWFFEATFPVVLTDWDGRIIAEYYAEAKSDWMTAEFVPFEAKIEFENPYKIDSPDFMRRGFLILRKSNPSGLPEHDDALEMPVSFK